MKNQRLLSFLAALLVLAVAGPSFAGSVEIRLKDGTTWRGAENDQVALTVLEQGVEVPVNGRLVRAADLYLIIETDIAGQTAQKTVFRDDIISMRTLDEDATSPRRTQPPATGRSPRESSAPRSRPAETQDVPRAPDGRELGVFYLPMVGGVGQEFRHDEIKKIGEIADEYGPGQIIVLHIDSNGGLVLEAELITETIWDLKERHRVIAWVKKAISAGCSTAMSCDEIYFMSVGTAGSVTTLAGGSALPEELAQPGIEHLVKVAERSGYSEHIARAMKLKKYMVSYDKDPDTGEVTFYGDLSGEFDLSNDEQNLTFNASNALDCGFSKGTADTEEDLAKLLDLPRWHEITDDGREMAKEWQDTVERCMYEVPLLLQQKQYKNASATEVVRLGTLISLNKQLIRWIDRCEMICKYSLGLPEKEYFIRENEEYRKRLADIRRRD